MPSNEYRNNHYVPEWYQKKFLTAGETQLYYLDLNPGVFVDPRGVRHDNRALKRQGPGLCFCKKDLYTRSFKSITSTEIESRFFGKIDTDGRRAVKYFENFEHPFKDYKNYLNEMILYMGTQKLRTPKGLDWLSKQMRTKDKNIILRKMMQLQGLYGAVWTECVWLIADASQSETKFVISDHPVTIYNRRCGPKSQWCYESNDPDVWFQASHTIFPLSLEKVLILTNLSWVRNPYQSEIKNRPNPNPYRSAIFKFTDVQIDRHLSEQEVQEINYIIKKRAHKYIAASKEEWLYPEKKIPSEKWECFGKGYLLMPDPRAVNVGGEIMWGGGPGPGGAMDEYGRSPGDPNFSIETDTGSEWHTLHWFQAEFAEMIGPYRRGRTFEAMRIDPERDSDDFHQYHLNLRKKNYKERKRDQGKRTE